MSSKLSVEDFFDHFSTLSNGENRPSNLEFEPNLDTLNEELNRVIDEPEVVRHIKRLKNNKAPGLDLILNELLKNSTNNIVRLITKLFNIVFDNGIVPTDWVNGLNQTVT